MAFLARVVVIAIALAVATWIVPGIDNGATTTATSIGTLIGVALIFGLVNAVIKPIIKTVGCAFYILTLGLISLIVNALLFLLVGWIAGRIGIPFSITGFWAAFWGAIVVAVVSWILHVIIPDSIDER